MQPEQQRAAGARRHSGDGGVQPTALVERQADRAHSVVLPVSSTEAVTRQVQQHRREPDCLQRCGEGSHLIEVGASVVQEEDGAVEPGTPASAPAHARMIRVFAINSVVAALVFGVVWLAITYKWISVAAPVLPIRQ